MGTRRPGDQGTSAPPSLASTPTSGVRAASEEPPPSGATPQVSVSAAVLLDRATLTMLTGPDTGAVTALGRAEVMLGRGAEATVCIDEPSVSRRHAKVTLLDRGVYLIEDLGSTNGTYVAGRRIHRAVLRSGDRIQLGRECTFRFAVVDQTEESLQRMLYEASTRDCLTGVANRRCLFERLVVELAHARRWERPLSFLLLDVDHFKIINDTFGHLAGDRVLSAIGTRGAQVVRAGDLFARYGGEEFAVIARDADRAEALLLAERLRSASSELRIEVGGAALAVTVSIGVVSLSEIDTDSDGLALFARADARLYLAKRAGRDRVWATDDPLPSLPPEKPPEP
jgi:two-component system cell cycle response regulator